MALVLAILIGFCWQTSVTQTHVHLPPLRALAGAAADGSHAAATLRRSPVRPDTPLSCPICRDLLHAGHFLPGTPPAIPAPVFRAPIGAAGSADRAATVPQWSHAWYGRGPPAATVVP